MFASYLYAGKQVQGVALKITLLLGFLWKGTLCTFSVIRLILALKTNKIYVFITLEKLKCLNC